jgi:hypothetical protein
MFSCAHFKQGLCGFLIMSRVQTDAVLRGLVRRSFIKQEIKKNP